jgi:hypothetical protein
MFSEIDINFTAFFLSGILAFALSVVWYHPKILGDKWKQARSGVATPSSGPSTPLPYVASFFLWTLSACFYAFLASFLGINSPASYFALSCLLWVAFAMPPSLMRTLYTGESFEAMAIDTACQLGGYYIFAAVHIAFLEGGIL